MNKYEDTNCIFLIRIFVNSNSLNSMYHKFLIFAVLSGAIAVALGAMGAHALKDQIDASQLQVFETAVRYQMYHTLALIALISLHEKLNNKFLTSTSYLF